MGRRRQEADLGGAYCILRLVIGSVRLGGRLASRAQIDARRI
jgi:hypothetical protein